MIPVVRGARNWSTPAATTFNLCTAKNQSVNPSPAGISPRYILTNQPVLVAASGKEVNQRNHDWVAGSFPHPKLTAAIIPAMILLRINRGRFVFVVINGQSPYSADTGGEGGI